MNLTQVENARAELSTFNALTLSEADAKKRKAIVDELVEARRQAGIKQPPDRLMEAAVGAVLDEDARRQNMHVQQATIQAAQAIRDEYREQVRTRPARWKALTQFQRAALLIAAEIEPWSKLGRIFMKLAQLTEDASTADREPPESFEVETSKRAQQERR